MRKCASSPPTSGIVGQGFTATIWAVMMSLASVGRVLFDNYAIRCLIVQSKYTGSTADEFADLTVDAQGDRRRRAITPADPERVARQPQIE